MSKRTPSDRTRFTLPVQVTIEEAGNSHTIEYSGVAPLTIGRSADNHIVLQTDRASRHHAEIIGEGGRFTLLDPKSSNGTLVDGEKTRKVALQVGATITIGGASITFGETESPKSSQSISTSSREEEKGLPGKRPASRVHSEPRGNRDPASRPRSTEKTAARAATAPPTRARVVEVEAPVSQKVMAGILGLLAIVGILWAIGQLAGGSNKLDRTSSSIAQREASPREAELDTPQSLRVSGDLQPRSSDLLRLPPPQSEDGAESFLRGEEWPELRERNAFNEEWPELRGEDSLQESDESESLDDWLDVSRDRVGREGEVPDLERVDPPRPLISIISDAWPPGPRTIGYEYNQKNHGSAPDFVERGGSDLPERNSAHFGPKYRVIGVEVSTEEFPPGTELRLRSPAVQKGKKIPLRIPEVLTGERVRKYFALVEPEDRRVIFELLSDREVIATAETTLPKTGNFTALPRGARARAEERAREEWERNQLAAREVTVTVSDDLGRPVPDAKVLLLLEGGGMITFEGQTDGRGVYRRSVIPGSYEVHVHAEVPEPIDPDAVTAVKRLPRLLSLQGRIGSEEESLELVPQHSVVVRILDEETSSLPIEKIWVTPTAIAPAYRYEVIAQQIGIRGRLESDRSAEGALRLLLGSTSVELGLLGRTELGEPVLITERVNPTQDELSWAFRRDRFAKIEFQRDGSFGGVTSLSGEIVAAGRFRERFSIRTSEEGDKESDIWRAYVMPGKYRITLRAQLPSGEAEFLPYALELPPGARHDLTPRAPWSLTLYQKRKDRQQQFWLAVVDGGGKILERVPGEPGRIRGLSGGQAHIDQELTVLKWQVSEQLLRLDLGKLRYETEVPFGDAQIRGLASLENLRVFNGAGSSCKAPSVFEARVKEILPEIKKTIDGSLASLGLPDGLRRIHLELDIFLPPGIGGTGGGGVITLDSAVMHRYACAGDPLPGAYRHEYGHNMGFGHDPYMLLAEGGSATDETLFGSLAYRLLHAATGQRTIDHLLEERSARGFSWRPNPAVFAALRSLFGPQVHKKMITERRSAEQTLRLHGLSSIERIATLYSLVLDRNVAWVFRAHGWPVFDARVDLGASAVKFTRNHPRQLNYSHVPGTEIRSWWVLDLDGARQRGEKPEDPLAWRRIEWPTGNIDLAIEGEPLERRRRWLLFRRIAVNEDTDARVLCASDVSLEVRINGQAIGIYDASPQQFQPAHDELMLNQKRPLPVYLPKGENFIEVAVTQDPGARGFVLALATAEGKPLRLGFLDDGPPGEELSKSDPIEVPIEPVLAGSFETDWSPAWIEGATEPPGSLRFTLDHEQPAFGSQSLRVEFTNSAAGALIQRVMIPPGKTYRLKAAMRSEGFAGEAFVGLFTGELGGWLGRTEPLNKANSPWKAFSATWSPGTSRVVYVACYVKGTRGRVWFDGVQLEEQ